MKRKCKQKPENHKQTNKQTNSMWLASRDFFDLHTALPKATADISNFCYKSQHFHHNCTVCELQMEALGDVHCYLWRGVRGNKKCCWN